MANYTPQEEKELNAQLKKWQNRAKRLILSDYYDTAAEYLNDNDCSILRQITNRAVMQDIRQQDSGYRILHFPGFRNPIQELQAKGRK